MTEAIIITAVLAGTIGILIGRLWAVGHHAEHDFQAWRDRLIGAAMLERGSMVTPLIIGDKIKSAADLKFMRRRRDVKA